MSALIAMLSEESGLSVMDVERILRTAPRRYKVFSIPKKRGSSREIAQPARELKVLQRLFVEKHLAELPVHGAATAYVKGKSIRHNALAHAGNKPILKMDFENFFPSITSSVWKSYCLDNDILSSDTDIDLSCQLLFRRKKGEKTLRLSIGAPSSPIVSNILMLEFDENVFLEAERRGISYTRYADDLTFSGQRIGMLKDMIEIVSDVARKHARPQLRVNREKTTFVTTARRRSVTGVVLTNQGTLSLGRDWKRRVSAQVHQARLGKLSRPKLQILCGDLAFANSVEPDFLARLATKYGVGTLKTIQKAVFAHSLQPEEKNRI